MSCFCREEKRRLWRKKPGEKEKEESGWSRDSPNKKGEGRWDVVENGRGGGKRAVVCVCV